MHVLPYQSPYNWQALLDYFQFRCVAGVEQVEGDCYRRVVALPDGEGSIYSGWIMLQPAPDQAALQLTMADSLQAVEALVIARVRALADLDADPTAVQVVLGDLVRDAGLRVPGIWDGFEVAVRAVMGQLITVKAACTLTARVAAAAELKLETPWPNLYQRFPLAQEFLQIDAQALQQRGIHERKYHAIAQMAEALVSGELCLSPGADYEKTVAFLVNLKGIGPWTANYIAMRALRWPDAFLESDYGIKKVLGSERPAEIKRMAAQWQPWRSYAVMHLWDKFLS